jgi:acetyltransferase-like isoleucine patch superfamily enzyme
VTREPADLSLDPELFELWRNLGRLREQLRARSWREYRRVNPFAEDLADWKEKGAFVGGEDVTIYDSTTVVGDVTIGAHTWIGPFCSLDGTGGLEIGSYCAVAAGTHIQTHDTVRWALSGGAAQYEYAPVRIGDRCFVGVNCAILKGVTIGEGSVVGAGSVVTGDVAPGTVVAGVPAQPIGRVLVRGDSVEILLDSPST